MMRVKNRYVVIVCMALSVVLSGCAASTSHLLLKKESLVDQGRGVIVASLGSTTMIDPMIEVNLMQADGKPASFQITTHADWTKGGGWNSGETVRFMPNGGRRMLVAYPVPPGGYSVTSVKLTTNQGTTNYFGGANLTRPLRFDVEAGKVTYIGVIEVDMTTAPNLIGEYIPALSKQVPSRMSVRVLDEFDEDNRLLVMARPELKTVPVLRPSAR